MNIAYKIVHFITILFQISLNNVLFSLCNPHTMVYHTV